MNLISPLRGWLLSLLAAATIGGCTFFPTPPAPEEDVQVAENTLELADHTVVIDENSAAQVIAVGANDSLITFADDGLPIRGLQPGDVMILAPSAQVPYALLRKVVAVDRSGGQVVVATTQATIPEAFESGRLALEGILTSDNVEDYTLGEGISITDPTERTGSLDLLNLNVALEPGPTGGLSLEGDVKIELDYAMEIDLRFLGVDKVDFFAKLTETSTLSYAVFRDWVPPGGKIEHDIAGWKFKPIKAGYFWIYPELELELHVEAAVQGGIQGNFTRKSWIAARGLYLNDAWQERSLADGKDFSMEPFMPLGQASLKVALVPSIDFKLYNVLGPEVGAEVYGEASASLTGGLGETPTGEPACLSLDAGGKATFAIDMDLFGFELEDHLNASIQIHEENILKLACPQLPGTFYGSVVDAQDRRPLAGVTIEARQAGNLVAQAVSLPDGSFVIDVPGGVSTDLTYTLAGYQPAQDLDNVVETGEEKQLSAMLSVSEDYSGQGDLHGRVVDATTGNPIAGATLNLRRHYNNQTGIIIATTTSDANGRFMFAGVESGNYTVQALEAGYVDATFRTHVLGGQSRSMGDLSLSPQLPEGQIRIVMQWGTQPRDLDAHLTGPDANGSGRFHIYWADMNPVGQGAALDVDDTTSYGPETITISEFRPGVYRYSIHDYSNRNSTNSMALVQSGLEIRIFDQNGLIGSFVPPSTQDGTVWTVFEMHNAEIVPINRMGYENDPSNVNLLPAFNQEKFKVR